VNKSPATSANPKPIDSPPQSYWVETLGCPKNQVDSEKIESGFRSAGLKKAGSASQADLIVVNTCAFIQEAREESIDVIFEMVEQKKSGSKIAVTGCMAERYTKELRSELKEVDLVGGFGTDILKVLETNHSASKIGISKIAKLPKLDLLNLTRVDLKPKQPWAYIKVAEGCDKNCGFCAIPSFRGRQVSRTPEAIFDEISRLKIKEAILVAQDIGSYGKDLEGDKANNYNLRHLYEMISQMVEWVRVFYIYPTNLTGSLIELMAEGPVPYFDLSLQHASPAVLRRMRRYGSMEKFLEKINAIRTLNPNAAFRTSFLIGYPGETEEDQDILLQFVREARLDWVGFFTFSTEKGTLAESLSHQVAHELALERLREVKAVQDEITLEKRNSLIGSRLTALADTKSTARSFREAPDIDGLIKIDEQIEDRYVKTPQPYRGSGMVTKPGEFIEVEIIDSQGVDLIAKRL
jgi:ribosomal protein S12 methylthiotransferase